MKITALLTSAALGSVVLAGPPEKPRPLPKNPPPPVVVAPGASAPAVPRVFNYEQRATPISRPVLVSPEQARGLIDRFKAAYPKMGNPRIAIYVNRELVDEASGAQLAGLREKTETKTTELTREFKPDPNSPAPALPAAAAPPASNLTIVGNVGGAGSQPAPGRETVQTKTEKTSSERELKRNPKAVQTLADRQTTRDVERLFGRPLRLAGVSLADQRTATQLLASHPVRADMPEVDNEQAKKDRQALSKIADAVIEILISSRSMTIQELSGERVVSIPDIQATAIRISDSKVLGQATSSDILGKDQNAANIARHYDVREISEATALALMEDMLLGVAE